MIEFSGELSDDCKRYIQKTGAKGAAFICFIITIITSIILIIIGILWEQIVILFVFVPILMTVLVAIPEVNAPMKTLNLYLPRKLTIKDEIISIECEKFSQNKSLEVVKKVIDMKDWYQIIFYFPNKSMYFICQKNLMVQGSIKDFEELFKDIIVSK